MSKETQDEGKPTPKFSRRRFIAGSAGVAVTASALTGCAHGPFMAGTVPKAEAMYQDHPKGLARCGLCHHFYSPNMCEVVAGPVSPDGWCKFYSLFG
jgi:hypothetical protein